MERLTKLLVLVSLGAALALAAIMGSATRPELPWVFGTTFAAGFVLGTFWPQSIGPVVACAYVAPAIVFACGRTYPVEYYTIWSVGLFGAIVRSSAARTWMLPRKWRVPLVGWALAVALTWPIIVAREVDFNVALLRNFALPSSAFGIPAPTTVLLILDAVITLLVGFVWFDWLCATFPDETEPAFDHRVITPLLASCTVACIASGYQILADIRFMNPDFSRFSRASGTLFDANALGMIAALWSGAIVAWAATPGTTRKTLALLGAALMWTGVWASGSRTGLVAALIIFAFVLRSWFRAGHRVQPRPRRRMAVGATVALVIGLLIVSVTLSQRVPGAARRLWWMVPEPSGPSVHEFLKSMWDRQGYGAAAVRMLRQNPIVGIGVGSFPILVSDYALTQFGGPMPPDNAQNWERHELAELGVVGSVGWLVWAGMFAYFILTTRAEAAHAGRAGIILGALVAVVMVSQVGLPTQSVAVTVTFWTLVFWYALLVGAPSRSAVPTSAVGWRRWTIMAVIVVVFVGGTLHAATTRLRLPMRARTFGWRYEYGFYPPEPDGRGGEYSWAQRRAVVVVPAPTPIVKVTVWINRHDIAVNPVHARVWHDDHLVIDTVLRDLRPVTTYVRVTGSPQWLMLRTEVDRVLVPAHFGVPDERELGLAVAWSFLDALPIEAQGNHITASRGGDRTAGL